MTEKALIVVEKLDVAIVFSDDGMAKILKEVETKAMAHVPDLSTDDGRKDVAAMAYRVARSKTLLDDLGKNLVSDWKQKAKRIDGYRKTARDFLDELKDKVRKPLTEWEAEQAAIKAEEDEKERLKIEGRIKALAEYHLMLPFFDVATMNDDFFEETLHNAKEKWDAFQKKQAIETAERRAENERLEIVRKEQEAEAARLTEAQRKIDAANAKIEAEKKAFEDEKKADQERKDREAFEKQAAENARVKAERDAIERAEREAAEKVEAERKAKAEAKRQESLKPDKKKLEGFAQYLQEGMTYPELQSEEAETISREACFKIHAIGDEILAAIEEL